MFYITTVLQTIIDKMRIARNHTMRKIDKAFQALHYNLKTENDY